MSTPHAIPRMRRRGKVDVKEKCRRVERRVARISCTVDDGAEAAVPEVPQRSH